MNSPGSTTPGRQRKGILPRRGSPIKPGMSGSQGYRAAVELSSSFPPRVPVGHPGLFMENPIRGSYSEMAFALAPGGAARHVCCSPFMVPSGHLPGGTPDSSRWCSEERAEPPDRTTKKSSRPGGAGELRPAPSCAPAGAWLFNDSGPVVPRCSTTGYHLASLRDGGNGGLPESSVQPPGCRGAELGRMRGLGSVWLAAQPKGWTTKGGAGSPGNW